VTLIKKKNKKKLFDIFGPQHGFTLIELLVALLILTLVIFAVTPLLVGSIQRIQYAGDKTESLYEGQSELEVNIAERQTVDGNELIFTFPENSDVEIRVPGGMVDVEKTKGEATAWLSGFVPYVPTINISPSSIIEGYDEKVYFPDDPYEEQDPVIAKGRFTEFEDAEEQGYKFKINNRYGENEQEQPIKEIETISEEDESTFHEYAEFDLNRGLTNSGSPYTVFLKWDIISDGEVKAEVTVRARLHVNMPFGVAVGEGQSTWVSSDAKSTWSERERELTGTGTINDVYWTGSRFVAVTSSDRVIVWDNREEPEGSETYSKTLNAASYGGGNYIIAGNDGLILITESAKRLINNNADEFEVKEAGGNNLNDVAWNSDAEEYVAVGDQGTIITSSNGSEWIDQSPADAVYDFKGVDYGKGHWVAVGGCEDKASIYRSNDSESWSQEFNSSPPLNDLIFDGDKFIAVGNEGTILTSSDGSEWEQENIEDEDGNSIDITDNLQAVDWGYIDELYYRYLAVGEEGTVLFWTGDSDDSWQKIEHGVGNGETDLYGVAIRWAK